MVDQNPSARPKTRRSIKILLGCSLALNLAVAGLVAGAIVRNDGVRGPGARHYALNAFGAPYMQALSRSDRRQVISQIRNDPNQAVPDCQARRDMFQNVLSALRATPFDRERLTQAVLQQADTTVAVQRVAAQAWLKVVSEMTDTERAQYVLAVEENLRKRRKGK